MDTADNLPDPLRERALGQNFSTDSLPQKGSQEDQMKEWVRQAKSGPLDDRDPGAIARAEARLADPDYPDDDLLEIVARNILLRERF